MFEYKVRCRHKLGWKEFKLYADTDIEEFFTRNSIDYVRNMTDTVEHRQLKEIEQLRTELNTKDNIINKLEEYLYKINEDYEYDNGYRVRETKAYLKQLKEDNE